MEIIDYLSFCRIQILVRQKQILLSALLKLQEETEEIKTYTEDLGDKLISLAETHKNLMLRVQQVMYRVESQSPVISEAENCMLEELEGLKNHLDGRMERRKIEVCVSTFMSNLKRIVSIFYCMSNTV